MRTDDFDDIQPEDVNEPRPDKQPIDVDGGEEFNEFDQPAPQGNSLGELWRNNPLVKIAVISIGVVMVIAAYLVFGGQGPDTPESSVGTAVQDREVPGGPTSEAYTQAINDVNEQRLNQALQSGGSTIPIPTAGGDADTTQPALEEPPVTLEDPLADWRGAVQQPVQQDPKLEGPQQPQAAYPGQQVPAQPMGPDPAAVDALAQAMSSQMSTILGKHQISGSQIMSVTSADYLKNQGADANRAAVDAAVDAAEEEIEEILVPAGTIVYAQTLTEANSDVPGPVLARISSGALTGSRVLGTFRNEEEFLVLEFNRVVINGVDYPVRGIALDPKTTLPAVASDVDHRYWRRFILPAAASFIEGMGDAIAQREQTIVVSDGGTVTSSQPDLDTTQELAAGLAEGTRSIAEDIEQEGDDVQPLVRVYAGTPIGILFLDPVINQE